MLQRTSSSHSIRLLFASILTLCCTAGYVTPAQLSYRVLFLGNSYTGVNNLPQLVHDVALSAGDTLTFDSNTPGGYQLADHVTDVNSQTKVMQGDWDYVVIQGQSQEPITYTSQFNNGGAALHNQIKQYNPCAVTMPYMTWGRKNGDALNCPFFPVMCTYQGMDTTIREAYLDLTNALNGEVSPVSVVWNYLRQNHPNIELYQADESHPSAEGSYAAACCFYTSLFKKNPLLITFNSSLNATDALDIRNAVKALVFDSLHLWNFKKPPVSQFAFYAGTGTNELLFNPFGHNVWQTYLWDFGDGTTTTVLNPAHSWITDGTYTVTLTTTTCDLQGVHSSVTDTVIQFCSHTPTVYTSQSWLCNYDTLWTQPADLYQWLMNGIILPETNQYLANYSQYGISGFSVISTLNGCSELSQSYTDTPQWSGYYFDLMGNPCNGDTVAFAVLHTSGSLTGFENILWLKNDTILASMTNQDTLLITEGGKYESRVIDPNSSCPLDTTSYSIIYNCSGVGIHELNNEAKWSLSPNPATSIVTINFETAPESERIDIYSSIGQLVKSVTAVNDKTEIYVGDLKEGMYFLRMHKSDRTALKLIKQ
jgi:PKD repeat protein